MKTNHNITSLDLSGNGFKDRAGVYIGEVLSSNPNYPITEINFEGMDLQEQGVRRVAESFNANTNIVTLNIGIINSETLTILAENVSKNTSLLSLELTESTECPFNSDS